jgi:hypothetical protein
VNPALSRSCDLVGQSYRGNLRTLNEMQFDDWTKENHQQRLISQIAGALLFCICVLPKEKEQGMAV